MVGCETMHEGKSFLDYLKYDLHLKLNLQQEQQTVKKDRYTLHNVINKLQLAFNKLHLLTF